MLLLLGINAYAEPVVVEGLAPIRNGDLSSAREEAIRNALADASRGAAATVGAAISTLNSEVTSDQTIVRSSANVHRHQVINEGHDKEIYRVTLRAELEDASGRDADQVCREGHVKRLLIGGFPVLHPEQLQVNELSGYAYLTASEIARRFNPHAAVFVDHDGSVMTNLEVPERVMSDLPMGAQTIPVIRAAAEKHRAQYVLVGRYHSLAVGANKSTREIDLEASILDASTGSCVARKRFTQVASGKIVPPRSILFGSPAHYATDFGRAYAKVLSQVASWAEATTSCQPFSARVIKVENKSVYLDAGAEQGISIGDTFSAFKHHAQPVVALTGEVLGTEKVIAGEVKVTSVYPRFSIAEFAPQQTRATRLVLEIGDEVYSR